MIQKAVVEEGLAKFGIDAADTPSAVSLPRPVTPDDAPMRQKLDKHKYKHNENDLPPLSLPSPLPALRQYPTTLALRSTNTSSGSSNDIDLRLCTHSSWSSVSSAGAVTGHSVSVTNSTQAPSSATSPTTTTPIALRMMPHTPSYTPRITRTPRPLRHYGGHGKNLYIDNH
jgi:hypothetical protein